MNLTPSGPHRRLVVSAIVGATVLSVTAACTGGDSPDPDSPTSSAGGEASAGAESNAPVQRAADGLPVDFPRDDVPVLEGEVLSASVPTKDSGAFTVLIGVAGDGPVQAQEQAVSMLEDAGWSVKGGTGPSAPQLLTNGAGQVVVIAAEERDRTTLTYSVKTGQ